MHIWRKDSHPIGGSSFLQKAYILEASVTGLLDLGFNDPMLCYLFRLNWTKWIAIFLRIITRLPQYYHTTDL
jgi:hypothetical protein